MGENLEQFDDPALQAAIRQLRGGHKAPPDLRARVAQRLAEQRALEAGDSGVAGRIGPQTADRGRRRLFMGIAATLLIAGSGVSIVLQLRDTRPKPTPYNNSYTRNEPLLDAMVAVNEAGVAGNATCKPLASPLSDPSALSREAQAQLNRPVPVADLKPLGWTLDAASFCTIAGSPSVRFHFTRSGHSITFVSLPSSAWGYSRNGDQYQMTNEGYPIAGYMKDGSLNCIVGEKSTELGEAITLRDRIRGG